jgi:hypothetical protein
LKKAGYYFQYQTRKINLKHTQTKTNTEIKRKLSIGNALFFSAFQRNGKRLHEL